MHNFVENEINPKKQLMKSNRSPLNKKSVNVNANVSTVQKSKNENNKSTSNVLGSVKNKNMIDNYRSVKNYKISSIIFKSPEEVSPNLPFNNPKH